MPSLRGGGVSLPAWPYDSPHGLRLLPPFLPHSHLPQYNPCPLNPVLTSGSQRMWTNMLAPSPALFSSYPCLLPTPLSASCLCVPWAFSLLTPWQYGECSRRASTGAKSFLHVTDAVVRDRCPAPQSPSQGCKLCPEKNLPDSKARQLARPLCHWGPRFWDKAREKRPLVFSVVAQACMPSSRLGSNVTCG